MRQRSSRRGRASLRRRRRRRRWDRRPGRRLGGQIGVPNRALATGGARKGATHNDTKRTSDGWGSRDPTRLCCGLRRRLASDARPMRVARPEPFFLSSATRTPPTFRRSVPPMRTTRAPRARPFEENKGEIETQIGSALEASARLPSATLSLAFPRAVRRPHPIPFSDADDGADSRDQRRGRRGGQARHAGPIPMHGPGHVQPGVFRRRLPRSRRRVEDHEVHRGPRPGRRDGDGRTRRRPRGALRAQDLGAARPVLRARAGRELVGPPAGRRRRRAAADPGQDDRGTVAGDDE